MSQSSTAHKPLGRGLAALLGTDPLKHSEGGKLSVQHIPIHDLSPGRYQPREFFDQESLDSLVASVREKGVIQPILVRPIYEGFANYEIVAGERRWRAAKEAGFEEIPAIVKDMTDLEALETGLIENIQRHDLNPLEEAQGFKRLMEEFDYTQDDLAQALGKSRSYIANSVRLLSLDENIKESLKEGKITAGHARALVNCSFSSELLEKIIRNGLNVRQTEKWVQRGNLKTSFPKKSLTLVSSETPSDPESERLVEKLKEKLGMKVSLDLKKEGKGILSLYFDSLEQLDTLLIQLTSPSL